MKSLKEYVDHNKEKFIELSKVHGENIEFFHENLLAKIRDVDNLDSYTLESHTDAALYELKKYIRDNEHVFVNFSKRHGIEKQVLLDMLFFSVFFHDLGKGTLEFYDDKILGRGKSYHPLYSVYFSVDQHQIPKINSVDYVTLAVLTHHTVLHKEIYESEMIQGLPKPEFFDETISIAKKYNLYYEDFFKMKCPYSLKFEIRDKEPYKLLREDFSWNMDQKGIIDNLNEILSLSDNSGKKEIKEIYGFITGNLIRADWLSSGAHNLDFPDITKEEFIKRLKKRTKKRGTKFKGLKEFQESSSEQENNLLIKIPTGEGKTEAALIWALKNLKNKHTKLIYTMPTQVTSNAMYKRFKEYFGNNVGIVHGTASLILAEEYREDEEMIWKEKIMSRTFSKPITVATLDSFILSFFNVHKWPLSQLNLENCLLIIDEVHSYDWQMLGAVKRIMDEMEIRGCKVAIMSATFPEIFENKVLDSIQYNSITEKELFKPRPLVLKLENKNLADKVDHILDYFNRNKKILIVANTVEKSKEIYNILKNTGRFKTKDKYDANSDLLLYHSQFIKKDRNTKEKEIEEKDKWQNRGLVLIATQIVEISLDINFEVLFTELAPIDSLVQRMGRINRRKDPKKLGAVFIQTEIDCRNKKGKWSYPYRKQIIERSKDILLDGRPSLGDLAEWVSLLYRKLLDIDRIHFEFENKFEKGFKKYEEIIERGPYALRFSTDNAEKVAEKLELRDIDEKFAKIDIIPKKIAEESEEDDFEKYENTVGIYKWLFGKLRKEGKIDDMKKFYLIHGINYDYECGLRIIENRDWRFQ